MKVHLGFMLGKGHHTLYDELINYPPNGIEYELLSKDLPSTPKYRLYSFLYKHFLKKITPEIVYSYYHQGLRKVDADLIHLCNHLAPLNRSWVVDVENIDPFVGHDIQMVRAKKKGIEKVLSSEHCKKIMPWMEAGKRTLERFLDTKEFKDKIEVVTPAIHPLSANRKNKEGDKIRLLFICSTNLPQSFILKGGEYALKCFEKLSAKYDIGLTVRSIVPEDIKRRYLHLKGLNFIEDTLPQQEFFDVYNNSDILLLPGYGALMATLESMAFGLPIVALNGGINSEFIKHGKTGFLAIPSKYISLMDGYPINWTPRFEDGVKKIDSNVVEELVEYTSALIEDDSLRKKMGKLAIETVEKGDLSIKVRNQKLKKIYEEATKR